MGGAGGRLLQSNMYVSDFRRSLWSSANNVSSIHVTLTYEVSNSKVKKYPHIKSASFSHHRIFAPQHPRTRYRVRKLQSIYTDCMYARKSSNWLYKAACYVVSCCAFFTSIYTLLLKSSLRLYVYENLTSNVAVREGSKRQTSALSPCCSAMGG